MNKTEFVDAIAEKAELSKADAARAVNATLQQIMDELRKGEQVSFPGFGTYSVSVRPARKGRNPNTGAMIDIAAARVAKFKAGKALKDAVNVDAEEESK